MRFLISMVFVVMLALSSHAFAAVLSGKDAEYVLLSGKIVASRWDTKSQDLHLTRVVFENNLYACRSFTTQLELRVICDKIDD